jgi:hypothetical protein
MSFLAILICIYSTYHFVRLTKINCDDDELLQKHRKAALLLEEKKHYHPLPDVNGKTFHSTPVKCNTSNVMQQIFTPVIGSIFAGYATCASGVSTQLHSPLELQADFPAVAAAPPPRCTATAPPPEAA